MSVKNLTLRAAAFWTEKRFASSLLLAFLGGLGLVFLIQGRWLFAPSHGPLVSNRLVLRALETRLVRVSLALTSYLDRHDASSLAKISSEGREADKILSELQTDLKPGQEDRQITALAEAHGQMREATQKLISYDQRRLQARASLNSANESLQSILIARVEPASKASSANAAGRLRSALAAAAEAKTFLQNPAEVESWKAGQSRFNDAVDTYAELTQTRAAGRWAEEAKASFSQCVDQANAFRKADQAVREALADLSQKRNVFEEALQRADGPEGARLPALFLRENFISTKTLAALAPGLVLAVIGLVFWAGRRAQRQIAQRLENILECVRAASAGDVSKLPDHWSRDVTGQLSQAVSRLIMVLARSENLVYHLAALVESSGDAIVSFNLDGAILSWNKGAQRIYGFSAEEMKGKSITLLSPDDEGADMRLSLQRVRRGERIQPFETFHRARNGRTVRAFVRVAPIFDSRRQIIGASFCAEDLTPVGAPQKTAEPF